MAEIVGSICSVCYANKGQYRQYETNIKPAQHARLDAVLQACEYPEIAELWISAMVAHIGKDAYFRHHDSGDLQSLAHLELIAQLCAATPNCAHWLPTREYGIVKDYIAKHGALPVNLVIRVSAMYPDVPVKVPASLFGVPGVAVSNVHSKKPPVGEACNAPAQDGKCLDCRACWNREKTISYAMH